MEGQWLAYMIANPKEFGHAEGDPMWREWTRRLAEIEDELEQQKQSARNRDSSGVVRPISDDPPTIWFNLVRYISPSVLDHDRIRQTPILLALAYADQKAEREKIEAEIIKAAVNNGAAVLFR